MTRLATLILRSEESEKTTEFVVPARADQRPGGGALPGLDADAEELDPRGTAPRVPDPGRPRSNRGRGLSTLPPETPHAGVPHASGARGGAHRRRRAADGRHARRLPRVAS